MTAARPTNNKPDQEATPMAPIVSSIEISRPQEEVFFYVTDPSTFTEWQAGVLGGSMEAGKSPSVGSKCTTTRRIGGTAREVIVQGPGIRFVPMANRRKQCRPVPVMAHTSRW
jgi:hypothetical protein